MKILTSPVLEIRYCNAYKLCHNHAVRRGKAFEISRKRFKELLRTKYCYYTGERMNDLSDDPNRKTLERIDSSIGYTDSNTVVCCNWINNLKSDLDIEEIKKIHNGFSFILNKLKNNSDETNSENTK